MASTIDDTSIDATFPVAGQDNNSQGFRDNFNTVKSNFVAAKSEITTLQTNSAKLMRKHYTVLLMIFVISIHQLTLVPGTVQKSLLLLFLYY